MRTMARLVSDGDYGVYEARLELVVEDGREPVLEVQAGYGDPRGFEGRLYRVVSDVEVVRAKLVELDGSDSSFVDPLDDQADLFLELFGWVVVSQS
jgi:hypothetical protein